MHYASSSQWCVRITLRRKQKDRFQKPIVWNPIPHEPDLVHLIRRPRIRILKISSSVNFVVGGLWPAWRSIFYTFRWPFFFFKCILNMFLYSIKCFQWLWEMSRLHNQTFSKFPKRDSAISNIYTCEQTNLHWHSFKCSERLITSVIEQYANHCKWTRSHVYGASQDGRKRKQRSLKRRV